MAALRPASQRLLGLLAVVFALLVLSPAGPASAAQRLERFELPSTAGNIDLRYTRINQSPSLRATVLLPDGYDAAPGKRWPVLYLLHGLGDNDTTWSKPWVGDIARRAKGFPGIIVMPTGGRGYYTDAWSGGTRVGGNWERYFLDEVVPTIEARYPILPGRRNHAIGGLSMGGYGAVLYAAQLPSYFGTAASFSGLLDLQDPVSQTALPVISRVNYTRLWGPYRGPYVVAHDPIKLVDNLAGTRLYVSTGEGGTDRTAPFDLGSTILGGVGEFASRIVARRFAGAARAAGVPITYAGHHGLHAWPYWRREIQRVIAWGLFAPEPPSAAQARTTFTYRTMAPHGNAWGLGFRFAALPTKVLTLTRSGQTLTATGSGTLTISPGAADADASGNGTRPDCTFTATVPFTQELRAGC